MLKLGLMGLGAIGVDVEKMVTQECKGEIEIPAILVKNPRPDRSLNKSIGTRRYKSTPWKYCALELTFW